MDEGDDRHLDRYRGGEETREQSGGDRDSAEELDQDEQVDEARSVLVPIFTNAGAIASAPREILPQPCTARITPAAAG